MLLEKRNEHISDPDCKKLKNVTSKQRAPRNRTLELTDEDIKRYRPRLRKLNAPVRLQDIIDATINQDINEIVEFLPSKSVDLLFLDPPYNLDKTFNRQTFKRQSIDDYADWMRVWFVPLMRLLKPTSSVYICGDWRSSAAVHRIAGEHLIVRNRISWEREKGRSANRNWKNVSEDLWFCTASNDYVFNLDAVKVRRKVIAPYTDESGAPKDWQPNPNGQGTRLTSPSNLWTDLTVPFWSMPENTDHPTQKPEKLLAKVILASSNKGDVVLDPFLGSGTTSVIAKKLGRHYIGIEVDETYCLLAEKRLEAADKDHRIQGYTDGVFRERNSK